MAQEATKTKILYGGEIKVEFFENRHLFVVTNLKTGKKLDTPISVTGATGMIDKSRPLIIWATRLARDYLLEQLKNGVKITEEMIEEAANQHAKVKKEAATIGSAVHDWAEEYIKTKVKERKDIEMPKDEKVLNGVIAFLKWIDEHKVKFIDSEEIIYSRKHHYAGIRDCKFTMGCEKHQIIHCGDFKTSKGIYNEYRYQVAGYQEADTEESSEVYGTKWLMRFDKEAGEFDAHEYGDHEKDFKAFLAALTLKKREKELLSY